MEGAGGREQARPAGIGPAKLLFVARPAQGPSPVRGWTPKRRFGGSNRRQPVWYLDENWNGSEPETPSMKAARTVAELRQAIAHARGDGGPIGLVPTMGALIICSFFSLSASAVGAARAEAALSGSTIN